MSLVSCLCVTRGRPGMLRAAVAQFDAQTYADRELVIVADDDDFATVAYLESIRRPDVKVVVVRRPVLGRKRNIAIANAAGDWLAVWDDDDGHHPDRLAAQLAETERAGKSSCVLSRVTVRVEGREHLSTVREWENTLICRRADQPAYQPRPRGSDGPVVHALKRAGKLATLDRPELYAYCHHGENVWGTEHFRKLVGCPSGHRSPQGTSDRIENPPAVS